MARTTGKRNGGNGPRRFLDRKFTFRIREVVYWGGWLIGGLILIFLLVSQWQLHRTAADLARVQKDLSRAEEVIDILSREAGRREAELEEMHERLKRLEDLETSVRLRLDQVPSHLQPRLLTVAADATAPAYQPVTEAGRAVAVERQLNALDSAARHTPTLWPVPGGRLTSGFGVRQSPWGGDDWECHRGIDIAARRGTPVLASAAGKVVYNGWGGTFGLMLVLQHDASTQTVYAHLDKSAVPVGHLVDQGQIVGFVGSTGRSTGPHLHFEVRVGRQRQNPLDWVGRGP